MFYHLNNVHISLQILITCLPVVMSVNNDSALFVSKLLEGYDYRLSPNFGTGVTTKINIGIYVISLDSVDERAMDYQITIYLRQNWVDGRLKYNHLSNETYLTLDGKISDEIWTPDAFFYNEKTARYHHITKPNRLLRLFGNGSIFYSTRISMKLSCQMKLQKFPLDTQICGLVLESYAYSTNELIMIWDGEDAIEIDNLLLPQFNLVKRYTTPNCLRKYKTGYFTCLEVFFVLKRQKSFYMIQTFIPTTLVVIVSWVSFWFGMDSVPGRISLGVLTILTMAQQTASVSESSPKVSYVKAIDVWMSTCMVFVFGSLLEFAIVNYFFKRELRKPLPNKRSTQYEKKEGNDKESGKNDEEEDEKETKHDFFSGITQELIVYDPATQRVARKIDLVAKICFPSAFALFNVGFWTYYLVMT